MVAVFAWVMNPVGLSGGMTLVNLLVGSRTRRQIGANRVRRTAASARSFHGVAGASASRIAAHANGATVRASRMSNPRRQESRQTCRRDVNYWGLPLSSPVGPGVKECHTTPNLVHRRPRTVQICNRWQVLQPTGVLGRRTLWLQ